MIDLVNDLSKLSTIPEKDLNKLLKLILYSICDGVIDAKLENKEEIEFDVGIGKLLIRFVDNKIAYKFIPSISLDSAVKDSYINETNYLKELIEKTAPTKLYSLYKELF